MVGGMKSSDFQTSFVQHQKLSTVEVQVEEPAGGKVAVRQNKSIGPTESAESAKYGEAGEYAESGNSTTFACN